VRPATQARVPAWDLAVVFEGLSLAPFESLESASEKFLTLRVAFLLAINALKIVWDLQALCISPPCLEFVPGRMKSILHAVYHSPGFPSSTTLVGRTGETSFALPCSGIRGLCRKVFSLEEVRPTVSVLCVAQEGIPGL
jgi:hypothetical protein